MIVTNSFIIVLFFYSMDFPMALDLRVLSKSMWTMMRNADENTPLSLRPYNFNYRSNAPTWELKMPFSIEVMQSRLDNPCFFESVVALDLKADDDMSR